MTSFTRFYGIILIILLVVVSITCKTAHSIEDFTKTPVVFVHGYGLKIDYWQKMIKSLIKAGYPERYLHAIQLIPNDGSNIRAAEKQIAPEIEWLIEAINTDLAKNKSDVALKTKVDLISHSMGALSARWYASMIKPERVRYWVSLAGAHHGTDALCGYDSEGADDLCPSFATSKSQSQIQYELNGNPNLNDVDETPYGIGKDYPPERTKPPEKDKRIVYWSIRISPDRWIVPAESAILDGAGGYDISVPQKWPFTETSPGNFLMTSKVGHDAMVGNKDVIRLIKLLLSIELKDFKAE